MKANCQGGRAAILSDLWGRVKRRRERKGFLTEDCHAPKTSPKKVDSKLIKLYKLCFVERLKRGGQLQRSLDSWTLIFQDTVRQP